MFVYAGLPPGPPADINVRLACRSFAAVLREWHDSLRSLFLKKVADTNLSQDIPDSEKSLVWLAELCRTAKKNEREELAEVVSIPTDAAEWGRQIFEAVYPLGHCESGFRSMGRMLGAAGPDRGFGNPRFLLETPMLAQIVNATVGASEAVSLEDWQARVFNQFGIVLGRYSTEEVVSVLEKLEKPGLVVRALRANEAQLRARLVDSGLAMTYSDGETEVFQRVGGR